MTEAPASPEAGKGETPKPARPVSEKQRVAREAFAQRARDFKAWQESQRTGKPMTARAAAPPAPAPTSSPAPGGNAPAPSPGATPTPEKKEGFNFGKVVFPGLFGGKK